MLSIIAKSIDITRNCKNRCTNYNTLYYRVLCAQQVEYISSFRQQKEISVYFKEKLQYKTQSINYSVKKQIVTNIHYTIISAKLKCITTLTVYSLFNS